MTKDKKENYTTAINKQKIFKTDKKKDMKKKKNPHEESQQENLQGHTVCS